jgi:hypothetical protein
MDNNILNESHLNGQPLINSLPDIESGTANEFLKVNSSETDYEWSTDNSVPNPISSNQILNSTGSNVYNWTANPAMTSCRVGLDSLGGLIFGDPSSTTTIKTNGTDLDFRNSGSLRLRLGTSQNTLYGQQNFTGVISQSTISGTNIIGGANNTVNGNINLGSNSNITLQGSGSVSTGTSGSLTAGIIKTNTTGTSAFTNLRIIDDNTGIYQPVSSSNTMTLCAGGADCLSFGSSRVLTQNIFLFGRCYALQNTVYTSPNAWTVFTTSNPLYILVAPSASGTTIDLDFQVATNYFGGQTFRIITRQPTGNLGTCRYRAQEDTWHLTSGGTSSLIPSNTYHTLTLDRTHEVICNVDTNRFYLIQG